MPQIQTDVCASGQPILVIYCTSYPAASMIFAGVWFLTHTLMIAALHGKRASVRFRVALVAHSPVKDACCTRTSGQPLGNGYPRVSVAVEPARISRIDPGRCQGSPLCSCTQPLPSVVNEADISTPSLNMLFAAGATRLPGSALITMPALC